MDLKQSGILVLLLCAASRSFSEAAESTSLPTENFSKITEDSALDLTPTQSLRTDGLFECAIACLRLHHNCYCFNYQISLERSGLCEVFHGYHSAREIERLVLPSPGFVFVQKLDKPRTSCLDYLRMGTTKSGIFKMHDEKSDRNYDVHCDFTTDPGMAWTLVSSRRSHQLLSMPFFANHPIDEEHPNWNAYRLSINRMEALKQPSTHWRITCNYPKDEIDYRDYVRAKFSEVDILQFNGIGICKKVEYINIRGYNCTSCNVPFWQSNNVNFHTDSSSGRCDMRFMSGSAAYSEDNFGYYWQKNKAFRCTKDSDSTTNWWYGGYA